MNFAARMETEVRSNLPDLPSTSDVARLAKSPTALLNHLSNLSPDGVSAGERSELADIWDQVEQHTRSMAYPLTPDQCTTPWVQWGRLRRRRTHRSMPI